MEQKVQGWVLYPDWTVDEFWSTLRRYVRGVGCYRLSSLEQPWAGVRTSKLFWVDEAAGEESLLYDIEVTVKKGRPWVEMRIPRDIEPEDAKRAQTFWRFFREIESVEDRWVMRWEWEESKQTDSGAAAEQLTLAEDERGKKPKPMDTKLDALLAGQTAIREDLSGLRQAVLARFDASEKTIIATVIERLDQGQLATVQAVLNAIEAGLVPIGELEETLVAVQHMLAEIQQQGVALPDSTLASKEVERLSEVVDAPKLDAKHKLKVTVPIIPVFLSYEGEVELKSGLNLEAAWKRLVARIRDT